MLIGQNNSYFSKIIIASFVTLQVANCKLFCLACFHNRQRLIISTTSLFSRISTIFALSMSSMGLRSGELLGHGRIGILQVLTIHCTTSMVSLEHIGASL